MDIHFLHHILIKKKIYVYRIKKILRVFISSFTIKDSSREIFIKYKIIIHFQRIEETKSSRDVTKQRVPFIRTRFSRNSSKLLYDKQREMTLDNRVCETNEK